MKIITKENITQEEIKRLNNDIEKTKALMLRNSSEIYNLIYWLTSIHGFDNKYESLYKYGTEDMTTYFKEFKVTNSFLTIGASGDQVVNAINSGAKVIDVFDSNRLCRHALCLKLAAIKALSINEFEDFYKSFSPFLFAKIFNYLDFEEQMYWGTLYSMYGKDNLKGGDFLNNLLFTYKRLSDEIIKKINPYLNPENYDKLKAKINDVEITYIDSDLYSLPIHIKNRTYDVINLSNIYEYINYGEPSNVKFKNAKKYRNFIINELFPHLNQDGTIMISYLYAWSDSLNEDFKKMYQESKSKIVPSGSITIEQLPYYYAGLTTQNLSYQQLFDAFKNDPVVKVPTEHIEFGQSKDMSHDLALLLHKK